MSLRLVPLLVSLVACLPAMETVWWEGESPSAQSGELKSSHAFNSPHQLLSGGRSLGGQGVDGGVLEYTVDIPAAGDYRFFVRKFWHHGPFRFRWNGTGEWSEVRRTALIDTVKLDQHSISWTKAGVVKLAKGKATLRIEALEPGKAFVIDAFCLVDGAWSPSGTLKPGEKSGAKRAGWWAFEPGPDAYAEDALDLRRLNETVAGAKGWATVGKDGDLLTGDGKPLRLWAVNTSVMRDHDLADLALHAKHLAKRGVNMVRHHAHINAPRGSLEGPPNEDEIDALQRLVASMKREGIYTTFSPMWAAHNGAPDYTMLFWDAGTQAAYKRWVKEALTRPNPYDAAKTPVGKDPALAIFQIQNEDSLFFWTVTRALTGEKLTRITALYHDWRRTNGLAGTPPLNLKLWELDKAGPDLQQTMRFFAETQHAWNAEVERFLREDLGCKALVNAGNWKTANQVRLLDHERWSYDANAVIGVNRYVGGDHVNPTKPDRRGFAIDQGDFFTDQSKTKDFLDLATNARQVAGRAFIISESTWVPPGTHHAEAPFLIAAYSSLTGVDGYYWFHLGQIGWDSSLVKWQAASPVIMGGWPAAAFMHRSGLIKRGATVLHEERTLEDLWELRAPLLAEDAGFDPNRDSAISPRSSVKATVDPKLFLVGPVEVAFAGDPANTKLQDVKPFIDDAAGTITSNTREIVLDHKRGLCLLSAPAAQGATGFLGAAGTIALPTLGISAQNDYGAVLAVALDGKPLATSKRVLVQITTRNEPYGWKASPTRFTLDGKTKKQADGFRIDAVGGFPWMIADNDMRLTLANPGLRSARILDENLYPTVAVELKNDKGGVAFTAPSQAFYVLLE